VESSIKIIEVKKIPIDKIQLGNQIRQTQVTENLKTLAESIRKVGLIQPVVVYSVGDGYNLIVGQRRFYAHRDVLKWTEISAIIIEKPEDDSMFSFFESIQREPLRRKDMILYLTNMYAQKMSIKEISKILGISVKQVKAYISLPRVPDVVRKAVESGELDAHTAVMATDAKGFEKYETSEEKGNNVLDLAKKIQDNMFTHKQITNLVEFGMENTDADNETLITDGIKNVTESISIDLSASDMKRLDNYIKNNEFKSKGQALASLILDSLDQTGD